MPTEDVPAVGSTGLLAILESRHETMLEWWEPWPACGPEGNDLDAHVAHRATVHDCINLQRLASRQMGCSTMGEDERHLLDFMAIHWARIISANKQAEQSADDTAAPKEQK